MSEQVIATGQGAGGAGHEQFGVSNLEYDLIMTMSNLLQSLEALERYAKDAEQASDMDCATLFREMRENNRRSVQQFRNALSRHFSGGK